MTPLLIALVVFLAAGAGATAWLRRDPAPAAGVRGPAELAELRWREFTRLVLQVMRARGYQPLPEDGGAGDGIPSDGGDILLQRDDQRILLSCKHGSAAVVGAQAILGLGKLAQLRGASGIVLATPGRFDEEAIRLARRQANVELLDGADLWPELRPYVGHPGDDATAPPPAPGPRRVALAWTAAAVLAGLAWFALRDTAPAPAPDPVMASPAAAAPVATPGIAEEPVPTDPRALEQRRNDTASAISTLFGVDRAVWSTQSTLLVYLASENADPTGALCPLLERYPELAASRVQLQPPPGSERPVRFMQCRAY